MNLETKITIYKFTPQVFTLTQKNHCVERINKQGILLMYDTQKHFRNLPNTIFISTFEF